MTAGVLVPADLTEDLDFLSSEVVDDRRAHGRGVFAVYM